MTSSNQNPPRWETSVPNRVAPLMRAVEDLGRFVEQHGADPQSVYLAQLAVEEMGTNVIKYGYDDKGEHIIRISVECEEIGFRIIIEDDGHEFDPRLRPEANAELGLEERTPGGWGISLIRRLLPGMEYERRDGRNFLRLLVPRNPAEPGS